MREEKIIRNDVLQIVCRNEKVTVNVDYYFQTPILKAIITSNEVEIALSLVNFSIGIYGFGNGAVLGRVLEINPTCLKACIEEIVNADFRKIGSFHLVIGINGYENTEKINCHSLLLTENDHPVPKITNLDDFETLLLADDGHYTMNGCRMNDIEQFLKMTVQSFKRRFLT